MDGTPIDLRAFFRGIGSFNVTRADMADAPERPDPEVPATLLDDDNSRVGAAPTIVDGYIDGIQASLIVAHREHRPIHLSYVAAGAVGHGAKPLSVREELRLLGSRHDTDWLDEHRCGIDVEIIEADTPPGISSGAAAWLAAQRERLERDVVEALVDTDRADRLVVDGSLNGRPVDDRLLGVVKTTRRRYLADESFLYRLPQGWRSPRFKIEGDGTPRYSCYLRLWDARNASWDWALIRLEAFDSDQLDGLAALCLAQRQRAAGGDARWDRHLASMRTCEEFLRSRRPAVFSM